MPLSVEKIGKIPYRVKRWPISQHFSRLSAFSYPCSACWYIFPTSFIYLSPRFVEKAQVVDKVEMLMYGREMVDIALDGINAKKKSRSVVGKKICLDLFWSEFF